MRTWKIGLWALVLGTSLTACDFAGMMNGLVPGAGDAMKARMNREKAKEVDGVPLSEPSVQESATAKAAIGSMKKVAFIGFSTHTSTPWVHPTMFGGGAPNARTQRAFEKALAKHGLEVVPAETVRSDAVYKTYDPKEALGKQIDSMGPMIKAMLLMVTGGDPSGALLKSMVTIYGDTVKRAVAGPIDATKLVGGPVDDVVHKIAKNAVDAAVDAAGGTEPTGRDVAEQLWKWGADQGIDMASTMTYVPKSIQEATVKREAERQNTPTAWVKSEPNDDFVAKLAKSLGVDGIVAADVSVCWDAADPSIGLCNGSPTSLVWYSADGTVLMIPAVMPPDPKSKQYKSPQDMSKSDPMITDLYVRTPIPTEHANAIRGIEALYRNAVINAFDAAKKELEEARKSGKKVDVLKKIQDFNALSSSLRWVPTEDFVADVDPVAEKVVAAVLQPVGK